MASKTSNTERPIAMETETTVIPRIPQEVVDEILDYLALDSDSKSLRPCALVSKPWVPSCRRHLFHTIVFTSKAAAGWLKMFPDPEESPVNYVRDLRFALGAHSGAPRKFFEYIPCFTNVERMAWLGHGRFRLSWIPLLGKLPQSLTSLTIETDTATLTQIQDILVQLPKLNDLSLSVFLGMAERNALPGMGTVLRGRFGGKLRLFNGHADRDVINMLLEVPTGLHFTEVHVRGTHESFLSTVRLTEVCGRTLVRLSYAVSILGKHHPRSSQCWRAKCCR